MADTKCKDLVQEHMVSRVDDIRDLLKGIPLDVDDKDSDDAEEIAQQQLCEYGLSFDWVGPGTFDDQEEGYFRYQISWGGPSEEFRIFTGPDFKPYRIEFWYLNWFDGACVVLDGEDKETMLEWCDWIEDAFQDVYEKAVEC